MRRLVVVLLFATACAAAPAPVADSNVVPPVDVSRHSVPLEEIVFDTFDGGSVPLSDADAATIERLLDAIPPINDPTYEAPTAVDWLGDNDIVLGYVDDDGEAWAFPVKILDLHEIVNDDLAGRPLLISYCPLCASGIVYDRRVGGRHLTFSNTSALHENDMVMVDRETGSYWWQVAGTGIVGPHTNDALSPLPSQMARWSDWRDAHPDGQVLVRPVDRDYTRDRFVGYSDSVDAGRTPFPVSPGALSDVRLSPGARVIAVEIDGEVWAWPTAITATFEMVVGDHSLRVDTDGTGGAVTDTETGELLPSRTMLWFALVALSPNVELVVG